MTPAQKFVLSCRQTGESAARLSDWLDHHPAVLGLGHSAVRDDIESLAARLPPFVAAADTVPCIALLAPPRAGKIDLLFQILAARSPLTLGGFGARPLEPSAIRSLLPPDTSAGGCATLRFTSAEMPPTPRGFPLRVGLLSATDLAAITAAAAFASLPAPAAPTVAAKVEAVFGDLTGRLSPQALPGLSERDVLDLREFITARWPGEPALEALDAARYWERFREIAVHVAEPGRRRLFALLWNDDAGFTQLFNRLADGLDRLGHGSDGYCTPEALLGKDKTSGWMTRHPRSIIDAATLMTLDQPGGPIVPMMNRFGQTVDLERAVIAGLVAELPLHLGPCRLNDLAPADLLDFPVPPAIGTPALATATPANDNASQAAVHFARAKAIYLFERATQRRDVTALVAVLDATHEDDTFAPAIGDWVETAQGGNARARERVRRGLFLASPQRSSSAASDEAAIESVLRNIFGADQDWPAAWTPNRPLTEIFWYSPSEAASSQPHPAVAPTPATALTATGSQSPRQDSQVTQLVKSLGLASDNRIKLLQLNQALQDLRRRLRQTVLRHHTSNDPAALADWRRGTAVVVQDRLQFLVEQGRLSHLQRALLPTESGVLIQLAGAQAATASKHYDLTPSWRDAPGARPQSEQPMIPIGRLAELAVVHWFKSMRRATRSQRLCRELRIEPGVLHNLVDELQIGAQRCLLASEIASAYGQTAQVRPQSAQSGDTAILAPVTASGRDLARLAAYACRIMTAYLEVLGPVPSRGRSVSLRGNRTSYDLEVADGSSGGYASQGARPRGGARRSSRPSQTTWEISFVTLVEDNIASAQLLSGRGDKDRELGELIQLFASGPFEVEP